MSGSYTNTSGGSDTYNAGAAHDSGLYDPNIHDNQIVAVFADQAAAKAARDALVDAGVAESQVKVVSHVEGDAAPGVSQVEDKAVGDQILSAFMSLFTSDDHQDYTHAVKQGHAMVVVTPSGDTDRHQVIQVLERSHPIDFDAKLAEWRQAGYDQTAAARAPDHTPARREAPVQGGSSRVRSYVANRDSTVSGMGTGGTVTNATPGATSSGMNSPRS